GRRIRFPRCRFGLDCPLVSYHTILTSMWKKILGALALIVLVIVMSGFGYLYLRNPALAPPPDVKVDMSRERVARGKYLFEKVMDCDVCHSQHDESRFGRPVVE